MTNPYKAAKGILDEVSGAEAPKKKRRPRRKDLPPSAYIPFATLSKSQLSSVTPQLQRLLDDPVRLNLAIEGGFLPPEARTMSVEEVAELPNVLFHGTTAKFDEFDPTLVDLGVHAGTMEQAYDRVRATVREGQGSEHEARIIPVLTRANYPMESKDVGAWHSATVVLDEFGRNAPTDRMRKDFQAQLMDAEDDRDQYFTDQWESSPENRSHLDDIKFRLKQEDYDSINYHNQHEGSSDRLLPTAQERFEQLGEEIKELQRTAVGPVPDPPNPSDYKTLEEAEKAIKDWMEIRDRPIPESVFEKIEDMRKERRAIIRDRENFYRNDSRIILEPEDLRSPEAGFDPALRDSPNLMHSAAPVAIGGGLLAATAPQESEAAILPRYGSVAPLPGAPSRPTIAGRQVEIGRNKDALDAAEAYHRDFGVPYDRVDEYKPLDEGFSRRLAGIFDYLQENPDDPLIRHAYERMAEEVENQYQSMINQGITPYFIRGDNPHPNSPYEALIELDRDKRLGVFPTEDGYGSGGDHSTNPLTRRSRHQIDNYPDTLVNDVFRAVHDFYGHAKQGSGFRAMGEENAYLSHAGMFSPEARRALAAETRGQNSWLNYGPHGDSNRTARHEDTIYAPQKAIAMPAWATEKGVAARDSRDASIWDRLNEGFFDGALTESGDIRLDHYSFMPDLKYVDPAFQGGSGVRMGTQEYNRLQGAGAPKRSYYGLGTDKNPYNEPHIQNRPNQYQAVIEGRQLYDASRDPDDLWRPNIAGKPDANDAEAAIRDKNYSGYFIDHKQLGKVAVVFDPVDVKNLKEAGFASPVMLAGIAGGSAASMFADPILQYGRDQLIDAGIMDTLLRGTARMGEGFYGDVSGHLKTLFSDDAVAASQEPPREPAVRPGPFAGDMANATQAGIQDVVAPVINTILDYQGPLSNQTGREQLSTIGGWLADNPYVRSGKAGVETLWNLLSPDQQARSGAVAGLGWSMAELSGLPGLGRKVAAEVGEEVIDPRYGKRALERRALEAGNYQPPDFEVETRPMLDVPELSLSDLEGKDFIVTQSDRADAGKDIVSVDGRELPRPVALTGGQRHGQDYTRHPNAAWAMDEANATKIMQRAELLRQQSGENPLLLKYRMAPTGIDHSTHVGDLLIQNALTMMNKKELKEADRMIAGLTLEQGKNKGKHVGILDWPGLANIDEAMAAWAAAPGWRRKEVQNKILDGKLRDKTGMTLADARILTTEPDQLNAMDGGFQNVSILDVLAGTSPSNSSSYGISIPGHPYGVIKNDAVNLYSVLPNLLLADDPRRKAEFSTLSGNFTPQLLDLLTTAAERAK